MKIMSNDIVIIPEAEAKKEKRIREAIAKLEKHDPQFVTHLEQLANLAATNKILFQLGLNFLKNR